MYFRKKQNESYKTEGEMTMYENYRKDDIRNHLNQIGFSPLDVMVTGATGAGKSSTLNSFFDKAVAKVGDGVDPETMELDSYRLTDQMRFWDTPGLGDGIQRDIEHSRKIADKKKKTHHENFYFLDLVLIIVEAGTRDIGTTIKIIEQVLRGNFPADRVLVALNQADFAMKGQHWSEVGCFPDTVLTKFLEERASSIQRRIYESTGMKICRPVYYSAKYHYNIDKLYDLIIDHMPSSPRKITDER